MSLSAGPRPLISGVWNNEFSLCSHYMEITSEKQLKRACGPEAALSRRTLVLGARGAFALGRGSQGNETRVRA